MVRIGTSLWFIGTLCACGGGNKPEVPPVNPSAPDLSFAVSASQLPLAADSITTLVLTPQHADGRLWESAVEAPRISSSCAAQNLATLGGAPIADGLQWLQSYMATGCQPRDRLTIDYQWQGQRYQQAYQLELQPAQLSAKAQLGKLLFFTASLAPSGQSCADCHHPAFGFSPSDAAPTQAGGIALQHVGFRRTPGLTYFGPAFSYSTLLLPNAVSSPKGTPLGGFFADGRAATLQEQAAGPLLSSHEMANTDSAQLQTQLLGAPVGRVYEDVYGKGASADDVLLHVQQAIAAFEREDQAFRTFNSKYDAVMARRAQFTAAEARGFALFFDAQAGNCSSCHSSATLQPEQPELFSNFSYVRHAVPRQGALGYNQDALTLRWLTAVNHANWQYAGTADEPLFYDLGRCGPMRQASDEANSCGAFKVPSLRNVAIRRSYFHNGRYQSLVEVMQFYQWRERHPERIYVASAGSKPNKYNDLPDRWHAAVPQLVPFVNSARGELSATDVADIIQFLCALTDGYDETQPNSYRRPAQCR